ncbi:fibrinogen C domain-containing protein 1 isoform X1 [Scyliorhinus canicula]|uniref:fibrinogen C domain-containing protein 1 isoform X1 n=1 Tax=Scyliorhinus canicula TaxID=7830 RepID=UPI0018F413CB|nr:fibrinogen C domain-containing protein 1 isoform X1 [Scyliorhinus canicula]
MVNDRWKSMDGDQPGSPKETVQKLSCGYMVCLVLLFLAVLLAMAVTGALLFLNQYHHAPDTPPAISTNQDKTQALVTIDRADSSKINIFIDPNCPDYQGNLARLEGLQSSLLAAVFSRGDEVKASEEQDRALLVTVADQVSRLTTRTAQLRQDCETLKRGQGGLSQELSLLQSEQGRLIELLSESQVNLVKVVGSVSDALDSLQREHQGGTARSHGKADLMKGPARARPRSCPNDPRPRDCYDIYMSGQREDGIYSIFPTHYPAGFQVSCDMTMAGGGWTVFQRRKDGSVNFFQGWDAYKNGFGKITGEHWLGLKRIHALTIQSHYELRIEMEDFENSTAYAQYETFGIGLYAVDPETDGYPLTVAEYSGTAGDSLLKHNGMRFTTKDRDNDRSENNCATFYRGAWWYHNCHTSNLNGQYLKGHHSSYADGIEWSSWTGWQYSLKFVEMKIRPRNGGQRRDV